MVMGRGAVKNGVFVPTELRRDGCDGTRTGAEAWSGCGWSGSGRFGECVTAQRVRK